jgi:hypothetical protein
MGFIVYPSKSRGAVVIVGGVEGIVRQRQVLRHKRWWTDHQQSPTDSSVRDTASTLGPLNVSRIGPGIAQSAIGEQAGDYGKGYENRSEP